MASTKRKIFRVLLVLFVLAVIGILIGGYFAYNAVYKPNVWLGEQDQIHLHIPSGSDYDDVILIFDSLQLIENKTTFEWVAAKKKYPSMVKSGRYLVKNGMSNNALINLLRSGEQDPVRVTFNNIRTVQQLAGEVAPYIEADSSEIASKLLDTAVIKKMGFEPQTVLGLFIPDTYEFYWNTNAEQFLDRMLREHNQFWTRERLEMLEAAGLTKQDAITIASIVEMESQKDDERATIAGVYINRLNKGMKLQADPTVVFAAGDFTIKRVLKTHLEIDSKYNTYMYAGLPPGPITMPSVSSLLGVIGYKRHNYLYFCAKEDFSGYHNFAETLAQHNKNAKKYRQELNKRKIY